MPRQQRWTPGSIVKIPLDNNWFSYGQMLPHENCEMAFFDSRTQKDIDPSAIIDCEVLFRVAVHKSVYNTGRWEKIVKVDINQSLLEPKETYIKDMISGKFSIYKLGEIRAATKEECVGLEKASVWESNHIEDRLRDHYAGRPCKWLDEFWRIET